MGSPYLVWQAFLLSVDMHGDQIEWIICWHIHQQVHHQLAGTPGSMHSNTWIYMHSNNATIIILSTIIGPRNSYTSVHVDGCGHIIYQTNNNVQLSWCVLPLPNNASLICLISAVTIIYSSCKFSLSGFAVQAQTRICYSYWIHINLQCSTPC